MYMGRSSGVRYTRSRKVELVRNVRLGIQKREEVLTKHLISEEEFKTWEVMYEKWMPQKLLPLGGFR